MTHEQQVKPIGQECKFAVYCEPPEYGMPDLHVIKLIEHYADGTQKPVLRYKYNFKRDFWITKKAYRNHEQKKEWEKADRLEKRTATQSDLARACSQALNHFGRENMRDISASPYLYGADILSTAIIKQKYMEAFPEARSNYRVAVLDTERDVINGTNETIMATVSMGKRVFTACVRSFVQGYAEPEKRAHQAFKRYLSEMPTEKKDGTPGEPVDIIAKRGIEWEFVLVDREIDVITQCFAKLHEWKPDILAIWNIAYDIPEIENACRRAGVDPKYVFSDPDVPEPYKFFRWKQGKSKRITASKEMPIDPWDQWHTVFAPASFYVLDAMCVYRKQRVHLGKLPSYSLDAILQEELGMRKLKFEECDGLTKIDWHIEMQSNYPFEYIVYNAFDCISMEELDEKIQDLAVAMPSACGCSDFQSYSSQPRRVVNELHWYALEKGYVIGTTSDTLRDEIDDLTISAEDWIWIRFSESKKTLMVPLSSN